MSTLEVRATSVAGPRGREIARLARWFHNLHLPDGTQTAPDHALGDFPAVKWRQVAPHVPERLEGWSALDVGCDAGCDAGFDSFELARRGERVTAMDIDPHYLAQARWAAGELGLEGRIELRQQSVYDPASPADRYDLVLFLGVLYHLRHPLLALDVLREVTRRQLVLQTLTMPGEEAVEPAPSIGLFEREPMQRPGWPRMAFIERALEDDPTDWWAPDHACVEAMLRAAGFRILERPGHEIYVCARSKASRRLRPRCMSPSCARSLRSPERR